MASNKPQQRSLFPGLNKASTEFAEAALRYGDEWGGGLGRQVVDAARRAAKAYENGQALQGQGLARGASGSQAMQSNPALKAASGAFSNPNTGLGLAAAGLLWGAGKIAGSNPRFRYGDNALQLLNSPLDIQGRAVSLGDVQIYPKGEKNGPDNVRTSYSGARVRTGAHEAGHLPQSRILGPAYIPTVLAGALLFGDRNPLEIGADKVALGKSRTGF